MFVTTYILEKYIKPSVTLFYSVYTIVTVRPVTYVQRAAVRWMVHRERSNSEIQHPYIRALKTKSGKPFYANTVSSETRRYNGSVSC